MSRDTQVRKMQSLLSQLKNLEPAGSRVIGVDANVTNSDNLADSLNSVFDSLNSLKMENHRSVVIVINSNQEDIQANITQQAIKGTVGSASLEFARHGGRVNLLVIDESTSEKDLALALNYLDDESAGGFTTGNTIDLRERVSRDSAANTVVVTGGAGGLGFAAAEEFKKAGYNVILSDLGGERLTSAGEALSVEVIAADLGKEEDISNLLKQLTQRGDLRALILHHGVGGSTWLGGEFNEQTANRSIAVNGISFIKTLEQFAQSELSKNTSIVCLSSIAGLVAEAGHSAYSAPKFAVVETARQMKKQFASKNTSINTLCPGPIRTALMEQAFAGLAKGQGLDPQEFTRNRLSSIPLGDAGTPEQIGKSAVFLAQTFATGLELAPTGGEVLV